MNDGHVEVDYGSLLLKQSIRCCNILATEEDHLLREAWLGMEHSVLVLSRSIWIPGEYAWCHARVP